MKTKDLRLLDEAELSPKLKKMKLKELEKHAKNLIASFGGKNYDEIIAEVIKLIPNLSNSDGQTSTNESRPVDKLKIVRDHLKSSVDLSKNDSDESQGTLTILTVILMLIISKKFNSILQNS